MSNHSVISFKSINSPQVSLKHDHHSFNKDSIKPNADSEILSETSMTLLILTFKLMYLNSNNVRELNNLSLNQLSVMNVPSKPHTFNTTVKSLKYTVKKAYEDSLNQSCQSSLSSRDLKPISDEPHQF